MDNTPFDNKKSKKVLQIKWYHYFSYWIFIWFLLYELGVVSYEPSLNYILAVIFVIVQSIVFLVKYKIKHTHYGILITTILTALIIDFIPFFVLYPFALDGKTMLVNILVLVVYIIYMRDSNIEMVDVYIGEYSNMHNIENITFTQFIKHRYL